MNYMLLSDAVGTIQAGDDQQEKIEEFTDRVGSGEFHTATDLAIPCACIDGRIGGTPRPNAAGGTNTLAVAEDLTNDLDTGYMESFSTVIEKLQDANLPIGGHDDEHASDQKCGCGACDKLSEIYAMIVDKSDTLRTLTTSLGHDINDEVHELIIGNAAAHHDLPSGPSLRDKISVGIIDHLRGEHKEVLAVINNRKATTLNRDALEKEFGPNYEAFNIDVWAFEQAAHAISDSEKEMTKKLIAMHYYNFATALVLCGPKMRVVAI